MEKQYVLKENTLLHLLNCAAKMYALEGGGVDNWCGYGESVCDYLDEAEAEDFYEVAKNEIQYFETMSTNDPADSIVWDECLKDYVVKGDSLQRCLTQTENGIYILISPELKDKVLCKKGDA